VQGEGERLKRGIAQTWVLRIVH